MKRPALIATVVAVAAAVAAVPIATATSSAPHRAQATTVSVTAGDLFFKLNTKKAKKGTVTFKLTNKGNLKHDFKIAGKKTPLIGANKTTTLSVTFKKPGRYPYICTVPGHAAAGMKGVFTVS